MLHPRNIVLVGATDKPGNYAERIWTNLIKYKFEGGLYPLNSKRESIWGVPCYKDFASLPRQARPRAGTGAGTLRRPGNPGRRGGRRPFGNHRDLRLQRIAG